MRWIVFYDGDCGLCSKAVRFCARHDQRDVLRFAQLQGPLAAQLGLSHHAAEDGGTMVVLREVDQQCFFRSDAVIELFRAFGGAWRWLRIARWVPRPLRETLYRFVARHRQRFFPSDACALPGPEVTRRLLDESTPLHEPTITS